MSVPVANINTTTDSWQTVINQLNTLLFGYTNFIVTANSTLSTTTGNSYVNGNFSAQTMIAVNGLRGGNNGTANTLNISTNTAITGTMTVSGNATVANLNATTVNSASFVSSTNFNYQNIVTLDMVANTNVGPGNPVVYRFPKASFTTGKFIVQAINGTTYQSAEMLIVNDHGTNVAITVYAVAGLPATLGTSPLGTFTANVNVANVELVFLQTTANSAVTVKAELIV